MTRWAVDVDRIERARVLKAWTRKQLAAVAHVDPKTLTDMCSGRRRPTLGTVQAVCAALELPVAEAIVFEGISAAIHDVPDCGLCDFLNRSEGRRRPKPMLPRRWRAVAGGQEW
jgi:transcriptional regulator with XRE-family HTH domain